MSFDIHVRVFPDADLGRGFTGADWFWDENGNLQVRVSKLSDWRMEFALAMHEAIEAGLCKHNGISQAAVDAFDREYDRTHKSDLNSGDEPDAPYLREHCFATACERILIAEFGVPWSEYDRELEQIRPETKRKKKVGSMSDYPSEETECICGMFADSPRQDCPVHGYHMATFPENRGPYICRCAACTCQGILHQAGCPHYHQPSFVFPVGE